MMSENTFTPGPWEAIVTGVYAMRADQRSNRKVARCGIYKEHQAEQRANARLIAAAPDLLAACERLVANLPDIALDLARQEWGNTNVEVVKLRRDEARAAIAKAKGKYDE